MFLKDLLGINKGDMISIVGAGGKTSLMFLLAEELRADNKVLVTTTTKIYVPQKGQYDILSLGKNNFRDYRNKGICVGGSYINKEGKIVGLKCEELEKSEKHFDYILVEADGSKRKPIKGWNSNEPVICKQTSKTIGVFNIQAIGKSVCDDNVHRVEEFIKITGAEINQPITVEHVVSLITHPQGLFKNALGEKILFINKVEGDMYNALSKTLVEELNSKDFLLQNKIVLGSLKSQRYQPIYYVDPNCGLVSGI